MLRNVFQRIRGLPTTFVPKRNTVIVKRVHKPPLQKVPGVDHHETPQHVLDRSVVDTEDDKYCIYEVVETKQPDHKVKLILLRSVDNYGVKGQIINVPFTEAHRELLLSGAAVYHSPEALKQLGDIVIPEDQKMNSSESARLLANMWSTRVLDVCMNMNNPWTLQKWHIKASFRKHRFWVTEDQIEIPGGEIKGPDLSLENKEFISVITINKFEKVKVRCRLHHLTDDPDRVIRLDYWHYKEAEPVWEHERQELLDMARKIIRGKVLKEKSMQEEIDRYKTWKKEREIRLS